MGTSRATDIPAYDDAIAALRARLGDAQPAPAPSLPPPEHSAPPSVQPAPAPEHLARPPEPAPPPEHLARPPEPAPPPGASSGKLPTEDRPGAAKRRIVLGGSLALAAALAAVIGIGLTRRDRDSRPRTADGAAPVRPSPSLSPPPAASATGTAEAPDALAPRLPGTTGATAPSPSTSAEPRQPAYAGVERDTGARSGDSSTHRDAEDSASASGGPDGAAATTLGAGERKTLRRRLMRACADQRFTAALAPGRRLRQHDALDWNASLCLALALRNTGLRAEARAAYAAFLEQYPDNRFAPEARRALAELASAAAADAATPPSAATAATGDSAVAERPPEPSSESPPQTSAGDAPRVDDEL